MYDLGFGIKTHLTLVIFQSSPKVVGKRRDWGGGREGGESSNVIHCTVYASCVPDSWLTVLLYCRLPPFYREGRGGAKKHVTCHSHT